MKTKLQTLALGLAVFLLTKPALAGPYEDAVAAYTRRNYTAAQQLWRPLAGQGNAAAQYNLGVLYDNGQGVPRDKAEALKWYRLAAGQGLADAQFKLGALYETGQGVAQSDLEALQWYRLAADLAKGAKEV